MIRAHLLISLFFIATAVAHGQSWTNYYDSTALYWEKDWGKTKSLLQEALVLAEKEIGVEHPNYAVLLNDLGLCYWHQGNYRLAETAFERSLSIKKVTLGAQDVEYTASLLNMAGMLHDTNRKERAESLYLQVLDQYIPDHPKNVYYAEALTNLGSLYEEEANYGLAEKQYLQALEYKATTVGKDHPTYAKALGNLGRLYQKTGNANEAEVYYVGALAIFEQDHGDFADFAAVLNDYGMFQTERGAYGSAEKYLNEAKELVAKVSGTASLAYAATLNNIGGLQWQMGNQASAEAHYQEALALYKQMVPDNSPVMAAALNNLAAYYAGTQDFEKALPLYNEAKTIYANVYGTQHPLYARALNNLASLYRKFHDYEKAEELYLEALAIEKSVLGEEHAHYAASLQNLGLLNIAKGTYDHAEHYFLEAMGIMKKVLPVHHPSWAKTYNNLALLHFIQEDLSKAAPFFEQALDNQFHQIRNIFPSLSAKEKESFYNTLKNDIERFNTFALASYQQDPAVAGRMYNNQLVTKGLLFESVTKTRESIFSSGDEDLKTLYNQWREERDQLARAYHLSQQVLQSRGLNVEHLEEEVNDLEKQLSERAFALNAQSNWQNLSWQDIRDKLEPGEAAVELVRFREFKIAPKYNTQHDVDEAELLYGWTEKINYAALIITPDTKEHPKLVLLEHGADMESKYFAYYKNAIRYQIEDSVSFQYYWQAIQNELSQVNTVYFSPDGAYYKINLNTLLNPTTGDYLLDAVEVRQLTSTRDLLLPEPALAGQHNDAILIGAPDFNLALEKIETSLDGLWGKSLVRDMQSSPQIVALPGTEREIEQIEQLLTENQWSTKKHLQQDALEENIKKIESPKVLHIATHGYFNEILEKEGKVQDRLLSSGLLFAGAQAAFNNDGEGFDVQTDGEDGILTAFEAMNLKLDYTDLVILSACETGVGSVQNGEGVYGLQRAFQVAGTQSIIFSLWKVNDEATQALMFYFYDAWMKTHDKRKAFADAQKKLRSSYPHPYYWGAFILIES